MKLKTLIKNAKAAGACDEAIDELRKIKSLAEARQHPDAPEWSYWYALSVIDGRWPEAEPVIRQSPEWSYKYARCVIRGRWPEAEAVISQSPCWSYWYAEDVIGDRWLEAE